MAEYKTKQREALLEYLSQHAGKSFPPNKMQNKIMNQFSSSNETDAKILRGCVVAARQIDPWLYPSIVEHLKKKALLR